MLEPTFKLSYDGGPVSKLNELIEQRQEWLHEGYKDAVTATAITALTSIRAATRPWKGTVNAGQFSAVILRADCHPAFHNRRRCFRAGRFPRKDAPRIDLGNRCVQLVPPGDRTWRQASVWRVEISDRQRERWPKQPSVFHVVAMSEHIVHDYLDRRFASIAKRQSGLAKAVLGVAMAKLSTRPPASEKAGAHVTKIANNFAVAASSDRGDSFSVHVESNLSYAMDAVKGGRAGVDDALKRAANRIAGMISHKANLPLEEKLPTPFPEVRRR